MSAKQFLRTTVASLLAGWACAGVAQIPVASMPLSILSKPGPNIIVTLDDSGSMAWAYVPDDIAGLAGTRRFASSFFNPMYYNPANVYVRPLGADGRPVLENETSLFTNAPINGFAPGQGRLNLATSYRVTTELVPGNASTNNVTTNPDADFNSGSGSDRTNQGVPAYYYVFNSSLSSCDGTRDDDDCYELKVVGSTSGPGNSDERENFANWYSFYRTRNLATISAASRAFSNVEPPIRVAWQALNTCRDDSSQSFTGTCAGWDGTNRDNRIRSFGSTHKQNFYDWLFKLPAANTTPLQAAMRRAGEYYSTSGDNSPYGLAPNQSPAVTGGAVYACRQNYHILMTDGLWNNSRANCGVGACRNQDGTSWPLPDGTTYTPRAPYTDANGGNVDSAGNSNGDWSLADLAFYYWRTDLNTSLANQVDPVIRAPNAANPTAQYFNPRNDPANWQHMVNFTVGLGLSGFFSNPAYGGSTFAPEFSKFESGASNWPLVGASATNTGGGNGPARVYDLWHAAVNSRGEFFAADNPRQLSGALRSTIDSIFDRIGSNSSVATVSARAEDANIVYQSLFNARGWSGEVKAFDLAALSTANPTPRWTSNTAGKIPAAADRVIVTWNGSRGVPFRASSIDAEGMWGDLGLTAASPGRVELVDYLRGDATNEARNGSTLAFRDRAARLGDIVNSDPVVAAGQNFSYVSLPEGSSAGDSYIDFLSAKRKRAKMLFVGANDGMLHGFSIDAATPAGSGNEGKLVFSYMPRALLPTVPLLATQNYAHRFYVDGSPVVGDAFFSGRSTGQKWRTVLLGSTGAGGSAVFAIDITDPAALAVESSAVNTALWEISSTTSGFGDLGLTMAQPIIARLNDGSWAAIIANGYNSSTRCAVLYIVNLANGALIRKIDTQNRASATANCTGGDNGLSTPSLFDQNKDGVVDFVYAGDLQGNVWKFNLTGANTSAWGVAYSAAGAPAPVFTATAPTTNARQPITSGIEIGTPPPGKTGVMLYFGTGRFFATTDPTDVSVQSLYGVVDEGPVTGSRTSNLQQQTFTDTGSIRNFSNNIRFGQGWFIDFVETPAAGERVVTMPLLRSGRLFFLSLRPQEDLCTTGGTSILAAINPWTGGALGEAVFDINGDNVLNASDIAGGIKIGAADGFAMLTGVPNNRIIASQNDASNPQSRVVAGDTIKRGRISWRQIQK